MAKAGRKSHLEEHNINDLLQKSAFYLASNFHKFTPERRYQLSKSIIERRIASFENNLKDKDGDSYITNIIGSFNAGGNKDLEGAKQNSISEARSILQENLSSKESVSVN